jgi:hypothetical protein
MMYVLLTEWLAPRQWYQQREKKKVNEGLKEKKGKGTKRTKKDKSEETTVIREGNKW